MLKTKEAIKHIIIIYQIPQYGQMAKISLGKRALKRILSDARSNEDNNEERKAGK